MTTTTGAAPWADRLTAEARRVVGAAEAEARGLGHGELGAAHLLLGLLRAGGPAGPTLEAAGLRRAAARRAAAELVGRGPGPPAGALPVTACAAQILARAAAAAGPGAGRATPGHLLLALLRDAEAQPAGTTARALAAAGASPSALRVLGTLRQRAEAGGLGRAA
jgi:ATP-dependent Clp protease ATP-binding subunit ClpC